MEQWDVLEFLAYCYAKGIKIRRNGAKVYVWRPSDLDEIVRILQNQQEVA